MSKLTLKHSTEEELYVMFQSAGIELSNRGWHVNCRTFDDELQFNVTKRIKLEDSLSVNLKV